MHLKPISRELRRELYGRRRKRFKNHVKSQILVRVVSDVRLFPSGTALAHAPENAVPAPGTDDGIVKDEGHGIESAMEGFKQAPTDPGVPPRPSPFLPAVMTNLFFFLLFLSNCCKCFPLFSFLRQASVSFSIKQICNSAFRKFYFSIANEQCETHWSSLVVRWFIMNKAEFP